MMNRFWPIIYIAGALLCVFSGYAGVRYVPVLAQMDWALLAIVLLTMTMTPFGVFAYGISHSKKDKMTRPSMDRHCFGWWTDTLQPLRVSVIATASYSVGMFAAFLLEGEQSRMLTSLYAAMTVGMVIGERLVYLIYNNRIESREAARG